MQTRFLFVLVVVVSSKRGQNKRKFFTSLGTWQYVLN